MKKIVCHTKIMKARSTKSLVFAATMPLTNKIPRSSECKGVIVLKKGLKMDEFMRMLIKKKKQPSFFSLELFPVSTGNTFIGEFMRM